MEYRDKKVLIIGMARSGVAAAKTLAALGAEVVLADQKEGSDLEEPLSQLQGWPVRIVTGGYPIISKGYFDLLITSPGVPCNAEPLRRAVAANIPVWSELELAARLSRGNLVTVTGTNGKTTTTALIGQMFKDAGKKVIVGGNIGVPLVLEVQNSTAEHVLVVEVSSFQLEWVEAFHPRVAVITNLTPDHLDRHQNMEVYAEVKARIFRNQTGCDFTILNYDDCIVRGMADKCPGRVIFFSREHSLAEGIIISDNYLTAKFAGQASRICHTKQLKIPGAHNLENALAAVGAGWAMGLSAADLQHTLSTFPGVAHRLERVAVIDGVAYINDSKGTNPDASIKALRAFEQPIILIAGGSSKGSSFLDFAAVINERVKHLIVLGETAEEIKSAVKSTGFAAIDHVHTLGEALQHAKKLASPGDVVLLSPACASYDLFKNYEHRGEVFKELVLGLRDS